MADLREKVDVEKEQIISQSLYDDVFPFLSFRHFFVHAYGFMLDDKPIPRLVNKIPEIYSRFAAGIETALKNFEQSSTP